MSTQNLTDSPNRAPKRHRLQWQLIYIFGTLLLILLLGGTDPQMITLFSGKLPMDIRWLALCALGMIGFWLLQAWAYRNIGIVVAASTTYADSLRITLFGEYYSAITPFASGGQPMQIGYYMRYGVSAAKATSIIAVRYIGYISAICICYLCALAFDGGRIFADFPLVFWLTTLGFAVNFISILGVALLLLKATLVQRIGLWIIGQATRLSLLKNKHDKWRSAFLKGIAEFKTAAECIRSHPLQCMLAFMLLLFSVVCEFSVAYFVYRALGLSQAHYFKLFSIQVFLYLAVAFVPTPGATGATEGGFYLFFAMVFPKSLLYSAMLVWRLFTYYSQLLVGGILVVADELRNLRKRKASTEDSPLPTEKSVAEADNHAMISTPTADSVTHESAATHEEHDLP